MASLLGIYVLYASMDNKKTTMALAIVAIFSISMTANAFASHGSNAIACEVDGYEAGRDGSFSQKLYETCEEVGGADAYYEGFIEGCTSVEGNTRDVCELATDAD
jgi:hypothetical protein